MRALTKNALTMDELLEQLYTTAKVDCQEAHRAVISTNNGLAALDIISDNRSGAIEKVDHG